MVERIEMPEGTLGFRLAGELEVADYKETIMPPIDEVLKADGELCVLFAIIGGFEVHDLRVVWQDLRADFDIEVRHRENLKRSALVTDVDWIKRGVRMFGWAAPGDLRLFAPSELEAAKAWTAA